MIKQSLIAIATLGVMTISASAVDTAGCIGCHGKDFEKKAMGVSKIVKDMKKDDIIAGLKGYKEGKGGAMKAIMAGQVAKLSDADIEAIATQIAGGDEKKEEAKTEDNATAESNATTEKKEEAKPAVEVNTAACVGCHGKDFEKKALGKSKVVKDMSKADIEKSLNGYKDGSYGGAMKGVMAGQVKSLDEAQIKAIAEKFGK